MNALRLEELLDEKDRNIEENSIQPLQEDCSPGKSFQVVEPNACYSIL